MWYQLEIERCPRDAVDAITEQLEESGALSITFSDTQDDPILEPEIGSMPLWPWVSLQSLFLEASIVKTLKDNLAKTYPTLGLAITIIEDQNWIQNCKEVIKPRSYGQRLWVFPSWDETPLNPNVRKLILDPGLAFGTGTHATTELCLRWLDKTDLKHKTLIDYGTGSGILALAALILDAEKVFAVDIDPQALIATENNALVNHIDIGRQLLIDYPKSLSEPVDILMANILLNPLLSLKNEFFKLLNADGKLLLSGILNEQVASLVEGYHDLFQLEEVQEKEGWSLLVLRNRN